jgi:hypothetical protein
VPDVGQFDRATVERLRSADPEALRASLGKYRTSEEVEAILARINTLPGAFTARRVTASSRPPAHPGLRSGLPGSS